MCDSSRRQTKARSSRENGPVGVHESVRCHETLLLGVGTRFKPEHQDTKLDLYVLQVDGSRA